MNEKRNIQLHFRLTQSEIELMKTKMEKVGILNQSAYLRKMALNGYCVHLDLQDIKELVSVLRICSNNLNQYAKTANKTGSIYQADIKDLQDRLEQIWQISKDILSTLSSI